VGSRSGSKNVENPSRPLRFRAGLPGGAYNLGIPRSRFFASRGLKGVAGLRRKLEALDSTGALGECCDQRPRARACENAAWKALNRRLPLWLRPCRVRQRDTHRRYCDERRTLLSRRRREVATKLSHYNRADCSITGVWRQHSRPSHLMFCQRNPNLSEHTTQQPRILNRNCALPSSITSWRTR
jgi:hypothetical protein